MLFVLTKADQACVPCDSGLASAEVAQHLNSWGLQMELAEEVETAPALSPPLSAGYRSCVWDTEARFVSSSIPSESLMLELSSSEELEVLSIEAGDIEDSPPSSPAYEELVEVVSWEVAKLNIEWPHK